MQVGKYVKKMATREDLAFILFRIFVCLRVLLHFLNQYLCKHWTGILHIEGASSSIIISLQALCNKITSFSGIFTHDGYCIQKESAPRKITSKQLKEMQVLLWFVKNKIQIAEYIKNKLI